VESILLLADPLERAARFESDPRLPAILPEVFALADVPQPPDFHPEGDALVHTLLAVRHLPPQPDRRLAWAALLHDVGKALTTREIRGRLRAYGHDRQGAELAEAIMDRLGVEARTAADVVWLVRHHMFALAWQVRDEDELTRNQRRFIEDRRFPLLLDLLEVDALASGASPDKLAQVEFYRRAQARAANPD
jgi:putative nucleotidyltransferase with HDIG domain